MRKYFLFEDDFFYYVDSSGKTNLDALRFSSATSERLIEIYKDISIENKKPIVFKFNFPPISSDEFVVLSEIEVCRTGMHFESYTFRLAPKYLKFDLIMGLLEKGLIEISDKIYLTDLGRFAVYDEYSHVQEFMQKLTFIDISQQEKKKLINMNMCCQCGIKKVTHYKLCAFCYLQSRNKHLVIQKHEKSILQEK